MGMFKNIICGLLCVSSMAWADVEGYFGALQKGDLAGVKHFLEEKSIDVNALKDGQTALYLTLMNLRDPSQTLPGGVAMVSYLLNRGATIDKAPEGRPGTLATAIGTPALRVILESKKPYDINIRDGFGLTPLMWAACWGDHEAVELLLAHGAKRDLMVPADKNAPDDIHGKTALELAKSAVEFRKSDNPAAQRHSMLYKILMLAPRETSDADLEAVVRTLQFIKSKPSS